MRLKSYNRQANKKLAIKAAYKDGHFDELFKFITKRSNVLKPYHNLKAFVGADTRFTIKDMKVVDSGTITFTYNKLHFAVKLQNAPMGVVGLTLARLTVPFNISKTAIILQGDI